MFWELFRFELYYRRRRAATYVYFLVIFVTSFLVLTSPTLNVVGTADTTSPNSPYTIAALMVVLSFVFTMITSSLVGVAVIRDVEHEMAPIIFTTPIHKGSYLFGRFAGSLVTLIFLHTGIIFGALAAFGLGKISPLDITWRSKELLPFDLWVYLQPFLIFCVSDIFVTGSIFFAAGALVRKPIVIYSQGIILVMLYQVANMFYLRDLDSRYVAALLDPFGVQTYVYVTRYWTPAEQNTLLAPFSGVILYNRAIWISIAVVMMTITYWGFSFTSRRGFIRNKPKTIIEEVDVTGTTAMHVPLTLKERSWIRQLISTTLFNFRGIWTEVPFMAIAGTGLVVLLINAFGMDNKFGTSSYPTTGAILTMLNSFTLFFFILMVFYSGEIVWKERQHKIHLITDATPVSNSLLLLSKFLCLCLVYFSLLCGFFLFGIMIQVSRGYYYFDLQAYFGTLFVETFVNLSLLTVVSMLIQVLSGNKFLGFVLSVGFAVVVQILPNLGVNSLMAAYASGSLQGFSQMNGFGHFITPFVWLKTYWIALALILFLTAVLFYRRGSSRQQSFNLSLKALTTVAVIVFFGCGAFIYYNTSVLNHSESGRMLKLNKVRYEMELKRFESIEQPKIVEVNLAVDLDPHERSFKAIGYYWLRNDNSKPINVIQLQHMNSRDFHLGDVAFGRQSKIVEDHKDLAYQAYEVTPALNPGDSLRMSFALEFIQSGFKGAQQNTDLVYNGTFIRHSYFPSIGYDSHFELTASEDRTKFALEPRDERAMRDRPTSNVFRKDADRIRFSVTISTDSTQIPVGPGHEVRSWTKGNRRFRQYDADNIPSHYAMLSGNYKVASDKWNDIVLEIYYHSQHQFNVGRMMQGLKDGLDYYTKSFGPYPDTHIRIVEVPKYTTLAQSFPGMIAFSESVGFILKIANPAKDLDVPYYVTAHELAHQWWGHQVMEADTAGRSMLSEGMAQYSALMVMSHEFPAEIMQNFLKYELDAYLKGRSEEKIKEVPLQSVRDQQYIAYNKSALVFFALQDYIGEENLNMAIKRYYQKFAFKNSPYPTSKDLIEEIRKVTPDSLAYLVNDMLLSITLYENKANEAAYRQLPSGKYEITLNVTTQKLQVDASGKEGQSSLNDWIDIGVYDKDGKLIYLKKHKFTKQRNTLTITVNTLPSRVGIDPLHKLIDRNSSDNIIAIGSLVDLANSPL